MQPAETSRTGWKAGLVGLVEGFGLFVFVGLIGMFARGRNPLTEWTDVLVLALTAGAVFGIGRGIAGSITGAALGALAGFALGGLVGLQIPWTMHQVTQVPIEAGRTFELSGPTLDGKRLDVRDYRGKVVLVDFWATWCPPCLEEVPHVLAAYERFHQDGFEVIAVSLDDNKDALAQFVAARKLPWPQIFFDEPGKRGGGNPLAQEHGIRGIPATFLLDREGRVVGQDLRGKELEERALAVLAGAQISQHTVPVRMGVRVGLYLGGLLGALGGAVAQRLLWRGLAPTGQTGKP